LNPFAKNKIKLQPDKMFGRIETVIKGVVDGMRYLHDRNIILQDLKPANIGFDESGKVRLFDFGMARYVTECKDDEVCGTPRYMAPEVMSGEGSSLKSDVYSFGMVLYEVCSLQRPFGHCKSYESLEEAARSTSRPSLDCIPSKAVQALIQECWNPDPAARPSFEGIHRSLIEEVAPGNPMANADNEDKSQVRRREKSLSNISVVTSRTSATFSTTSLCREDL
jgi:serine/threonine protein kinase